MEEYVYFLLSIQENGHQVLPGGYRSRRPGDDPPERQRIAREARLGRDRSLPGTPEGILGRSLGESDVSRRVA